MRSRGMRIVLALLAVFAMEAQAARPRPDEPVGELVLDLDAPVVDATIAGVPLRLTVALDGRDTVQLNPDAAARLPLPFQEAGEIEVGRITLHGRQARADGIVAGRAIPLVIETHGRPCCAGVDGSIGPEQLPFARIRYVRGQRRAGLPGRRYPATVTAEAGLAAITRIDGEPITVKLAPSATETIATGSAGAILAAAKGGVWAGPRRAVPVAFDVARPARPMRFETAPVLLGFPIGTILVRTADFRGGRTLPVDPAPVADIVVRGRPSASQHEWRAVTLGRAQLDHCSEIIVERVPEPMLELHCTEQGR